MKRINAKGITRARTAEERIRRHFYGEDGATFSKGKYMVLGGNYVGTITTFYSKDCLLAEIYEV